MRSYHLYSVLIAVFCGILGLIFGSLGGIFPGFALNGEGLLSLLLLAGAAVLTARLAGRD